MNLIFSAVVPKNEPPIFNEAFLPKIIPFGFIKNILALPLALIIPSILEIEFPVTLVKMFSTELALLKKASPEVGILNFLKL